MNNITPFATDVFQEVFRYMETIDLKHQEQNQLFRFFRIERQQEILKKLTLLGFFLEI